MLTFLDVVHQIPNLRDILPSYSILLLSSTRELNNLIRVVISPTGAQPNGNILLLDPYPEHISRALWYAGRAILELGKEFTFSPLSVEAMFAVPLTGLSILQKVSFSSRERLRALQQLNSSPDVVNAVNPSSPTMFPSPVFMSSRSIGLESAEHLTDEIATYPNLINDSVERRERALGIDQNASFSEIDISFIGELDLNQFDMLIGQWEFMVSVSLLGRARSIILRFSRSDFTPGLFRSGIKTLSSTDYYHTEIYSNAAVHFRIHHQQL